MLCKSEAYPSIDAISIVGPPSSHVCQCCNTANPASFAYAIGAVARPAGPTIHGRQTGVNYSLRCVTYFDVCFEFTTVFSYRKWIYKIMRISNLIALKDGTWHTHAHVHTQDTHEIKQDKDGQKWILITYKENSLLHAFEPF